ncbi:MAG: hypothetical protein K6A36_04485 [Paludibacteraceae bacterium]|nr:hypothetical protein [Paludibacteraceae bacterium]
MKRSFFIISTLICLGGAASAAPLSISNDYDCGTTVKITAEPEQGYQFVEWSDGSTENPREIEVNAENAIKVFTATFTEKDPTALDQIESSPRARKVIIDQKMYIIFGDKLYDARGALVH